MQVAPSDASAKAVSNRVFTFSAANTPLATNVKLQAGPHFPSSSPSTFSSCSSSSIDFARLLTEGYTGASLPAVDSLLKVLI